ALAVEGPATPSSFPAGSSVCWEVRVLDEVVSRLEAVVASLQADTLDPAVAERLVSTFARAKRIAAAGEALCAGRVASSGRWRASGARSEADWLARETGETVGRARETLTVAQQLATLPATDELFRSGRLSAPQVAAVASAAAVDPRSEQLLLA